jgi:hypothetical protein
VVEKSQSATDLSRGRGRRCQRGSRRVLGGFDELAEVSLLKYKSKGQRVVRKARAEECEAARRRKGN